MDGEGRDEAGSIASLEQLVNHQCLCHMGNNTAHVCFRKGSQVSACVTDQGGKTGGGETIQEVIFVF